MFRHYALLSLISVFLTAVDASPASRSTGKATLSFTTKINQRGGLDIVEKDRARVQEMIQGHRLRNRGTYQVSANNIFVTYTAEVGVGTPPTNYELIIDTGSSNTWVGAGKPYVKTNTSENTGDPFFVSYGSGYVIGEEWTDTVTLSRDLVIRQQSIGVASWFNGFSGVDGILGLGPIDLTNNTVAGVDKVPTVLGNLFSQGTISQEVLGIYYIPSSEPSSTGELTFGGYDESATTSPVVYAPLTTKGNPSRYWGIEQSITYGADTILPSTTGIVDTGTTFIYIATDAFQQYQARTGATLDDATGLLKITYDQYKNLQPLVFNIGGKPFELTPNAQIWPRSLNALINGGSDAIYLIVNKIGSNEDFGFVNGYTFLERFYSVYDTTNRRVGFATTTYTKSEHN